MPPSLLWILDITNFHEHLKIKKDVLTHLQTLRGENDIITKEVETAIKRLKSSKSPFVTYNVTGKMIKYGGEMLKKEMYGVCNRVWKEGKAPEEYKVNISANMQKGRVQKLPNCCSDEPRW